MRHKLDVLKRHCDQVGRPYEEIEKTGLDTIRLAPGGLTPAQLIERFQVLREIGFQHVIFNMPNVSEIKPLEIIGQQVIPEIKGF
jgi:hypothetical protein